MIFYKELNFKSRDYEYNLDINNHLTLIDGDSAIGKTLMLKNLKNAINNNEVNTEKHPIIIIIEMIRNNKPEISNEEGCLIIIDNFDEIAKNTPDIIDQIDIKKNQYILVSRAYYPTLNIPMWCCSTLDTATDNKIKLSYYNEPLRSVMIK